LLRRAPKDVLTKPSWAVILSDLWRSPAATANAAQKGVSALPSSTALPEDRRVLIVDASADSREVLRASLERHGVTIIEAEDSRAGLELARRHRPQVVVLDLETTRDESARREFSRQPRLIILANYRREAALVGAAHYVGKPYQYAPLIRTIVQLLEQSSVEPPHGGREQPGLPPSSGVFPEEQPSRSA
jgi:CheY-like chemotaxis protein